ALHGEPKLGGVAGDVSRLDALLIGTIRLMIADDLFDADSALRLYADRFLRHFRFLGVVEREKERRLDGLHADEEVAPLAADIRRLPIAGSVDTPRPGVKIAGH